MTVKEKTSVGIIALLCLVAGFGIGKLMITTPDVPNSSGEIDKIAPVPKNHIKTDEKSIREIAKLRKRVTELEAILKNVDPAREHSPAIQPSPKVSKHSYRERMERMKKENPEQYAEIRDRIKEMREQAVQRENLRSDLFTSVDTAYMTPEQKEIHSRILDARSKIEQYRALIQDKGPRSLSEEQRQEFFETAKELRTLYPKERDALISTVMESAGFSKDETAVFVDQMQMIYDMTTPDHPRGNFRGFRNFFNKNTPKQ